jgi:predicted transposase/invertase (TIGR01784 family)
MTKEEEEKGVFARLTYDTIFKIVFAKEENRGSLLFLLNTCLRPVLKEPITSVTNVQTAEPGETGDSRVAMLDMQCEDASGARFIVEMQVREQKHFIKRTHFYLSRTVSNLAKKGKTEIDGRKADYDYDIPVVYSLSFLGFDMDFGENCDEMVQYLSIHNDLHPEVSYDMMHMVYVLLPRLGKAEEDCQNALDRLVFAFKNAHTLKEKPRSFIEKEFVDIFESAKICNLKPEELMDYEIEKKRFSDYAAAWDFAQEKTRKEGRQEGRKETLAEVLSLWRQGYTPDDVEKKLGLA